ncbi:MAG TPA: IS1182 family transposase [candidate division Zixibacteria bacterium]|nr:IS1182 family transposase [candidate division Zixibacteria bacterium]
MTFYKDFKDQASILPPNIRDLIPKNHICHLVDKIIQNIDLTDIEKRYEGAGHPAYHPKIILKLLILGQIDGIRSSRKIAKNTRENVVYMYMAGLLQPDFRTIGDFRKNNLELVKSSFQEVVKFAKDLGMVSLGHISIDGTKIKANASNYSAINKNDFSKLKELVERELEEGIRVDEEEDRIYGDKNTDELPYNIFDKTIAEKLKERYQSGSKEQKEKIKKQVEKIEKEIKKAESAINATDPESRFMPNNKKVMEYSYNPQITADSSFGIIISNDVSSEIRDVNQLQPQIIQAEENVGILPEGTKVSADYGYSSSKNLKFMKEKRLDGYIPDEKRASVLKRTEGKAENLFGKENFEYDPAEDCFICPNGRKLTFRFEYLDISKKKNVRVYKGTQCKQCPDRMSCAKNSRDGKVINDYEGMEAERRKMAEKMLSRAGALIYQTRKKVVECIFGHVKRNLGFKEFLMRGIKGAKIEFNLACIASNLIRIWNFMNGFCGIKC